MRILRTEGKRACFWVLAWSLHALVFAQQGLREGTPLPLEVSALSMPAATSIEGQGTLVYELIVSNPGAAAYTLVELSITDDLDQPLAMIEGKAWKEVAQALPAANGKAISSNGLRMAAGARFVLFLWIELADGAPVPTEVNHQFVAETEGHGLEWLHSGPRLSLVPPPMLIDSPVRGGLWSVGNGFANDSNHRRVYVAAGSLWIPQRFGADFNKLDPVGNNAVNDGRNLSDFHAYGEALYAVADGEVVVVHDGLKEVPAGMPPGQLAWKDMPGNHLILKLGPRAYAMYVHLQAGRMQVQPGQRIKRGTLLGYIGNSGNTSAPHLHFHLGDGPSVNNSQGIPFHFRSFGRVLADYRFRVDQQPLPEDSTPFSQALPRRGSVIRFGD